LDVNEVETSSLGTFSSELKYRISGASASRFKEFYCMCSCILTL
jgi:hypothetical protein